MCDIMIKTIKQGGIAVSVDVLQEKIRKMKNPSVLVLEAYSELLPPQFSGEETPEIGRAHV